MSAQQYVYSTALLTRAQEGTKISKLNGIRVNKVSRIALIVLLLHTQRTLVLSLFNQAVPLVMVLGVTIGLDWS